MFQGISSSCKNRNVYPYLRWNHTHDTLNQYNGNARIDVNGETTCVYMFSVQHHRIHMDIGSASVFKIK